MRAIPEEFVDVVQAEREALWLLASRARAAGESGEPTALREIAAEIRRRIARGDDLTIGNLEPHLDDIVAQLDLIYDAAFPPPAISPGSADRRTDITGLLDAPWPTAHRRALLATVLGRDTRHHLRLDEPADLAISTGDVQLARVLVFTPLGRMSRDDTGRILRSLHEAGHLDAAVVEQAVTDDRYLGHILDDRPGDEFARALRRHVDELTWRLVTAATPPDWSELPKALVPSGLRFVLLAMDWTGDPRTAAHLGAADLSPAEQADLVELLRERSKTEQLRVYGWRSTDAPEFLPVFGLERAAPLLRLIRAMPAHEAFRVDRAEVLAAVDRAGLDTTRRLLELEPNELISAVLGDNRPAVLKRLRNNALQGIAAFGLLPLPPTETTTPTTADPSTARSTVGVMVEVPTTGPATGASVVAPAVGVLAGAPSTVVGVGASVTTSAAGPTAAGPGGPTAAGPASEAGFAGSEAGFAGSEAGFAGSEAGESLLDRYLVIREVGKRGARFGPGRRVSHAAAVSVALDHLAQVAGFDGADRLEWDCEARLAERGPGEVTVGEYRIVLRFDGGDPVLGVERGGRRLKSVPGAVRADPAYKQMREYQEQLRDQCRRMRAGLIERLVATGGSLAPDELERLLSLPAAAALLPGLLWRDVTGLVGGLDEVDRSGSVTAVHPVELHEAGTLTAWQAEIVRRGREQPVRQVFREIYVPAADERRATVSARFDGRAVDGRVAGQLLSGRGWRLHSRHDEYQVTLPIGGLVAVLTCAFHGYFGMGEVIVGGLGFLRDGVLVPLGEVPPVVFSERIRDLDLMVSTAHPVTER
ncbi:DUF4132 domain-containing protein [Actinoplanes couchii]|uniref:DUF4132 domain-containing protein n=1 Tax=Actinoplanes couchii TaxID=403638 RepID=A0ABQ3XGZ0_9ACTN|nr:DUF4132 domain-containing protein [Actinoplanes couchii]MDR6320761.1 hypothetical protein [Actinoplanes couchii]GID57754.1 hypothetical protein Aco03nite_061580 [Actinoplanes couchii]